LRCTNVVDERLSFTRAELCARSRWTYRLRQSPISIRLRHGIHDLGVLDEVFCQSHISFPDEVLEQLKRLNGRPRVADLAAHVGLFPVRLLRHFPSAHLTAAEPDPDNARALRACVEINGWERQIRLIEACAGNQDGTVSFATGHSSGSRVVTCEDVERTDLIPSLDVLPLLGDIDLIKMDMEGGEWAVLTDDWLSSLAARSVVREYHPYLCPEGDPYTVAVTLLRAANYDILPIFRSSAGVGMLWAYG
jgi:FkbM family methyltransferase